MGIKVVAENDSGVAAAIVAEIAAMRLSMTNIVGRVNREKQAEFDIKVALNKRSDIDLLINRLKKDGRIIQAYRTSNL